MIRRALLLLAAVSSFTFASAEQAYKQLFIEKIEFEMASPDVHINNESLKSRIKSKEGDYFSQTVFDSDLKALVKEFDAIEPNFEVVDGKVFITIKLNVKPRIRSIQFRGNHDYSNSKLMGEIGINPGEAFDGFKFNAAFHKLKGFYIQKGYFEAELDYDVVRDPITNEVDIIVKVCEGRTGKIRGICFHGFTAEEKQCVLETMVTKKWNLITSFLSNDGIYHQEMIQYDQYQIVNLLQNGGYADASVTITTTEIPKKGIMLDITAEKGQRYKFGNISYEGNQIYTNDEIENCFYISEGCWYSPEAVRLTVTGISDKYGACGYIDNIVDYDLELDPETSTYSVKITIDEGEQFRVGMIKILGNCSTQNSVILHEILMVPGEVFNLNCLKLTEQRLNNIGYFKTVNVYAVRTENPTLSEGNYRDVHIEVEECSTGNISAFLGLSTAQDFFGGIHLTEKNFNAAGLRCLFSGGGPSVLRGGGEYLNLNTTIGQKSRSYTLSWTKPYFRDTPWIVGFDIDTTNNRYISKAYSIDAWGFNIHGRYPINICTSFGTHYRYRESQTNERKQGESISDPRLLEDVHNGGKISAMGAGIFYDSTDDICRPLRGRRSHLDFEVAGIGGDHDFVSLGWINTQFIPVTSKSTFKIRADFKYILPYAETTYDSMPVDERLFLGGNTNVRGYEPYAIGPQYDDTVEPRGGISLNLFSLEYNYYLNSRMEFFTFFDAGMLSKDSWSFGNLFTSVGFGTRLCVFSGGPPITLGLGYPIKPKNKEDVKNFFFSMGGSF